MSTRIMAACWPIQMSPTQKAVLISLADQANDQGVCWPSIKTICERTCLSERAVRNAIRSLEETGFLSSDSRAGCSNSYTITPAPDAAPAPDAPRHQMPGRAAPDAGEGGTRCRGPRHDVPPNRNRTVKEPSMNRKSDNARESKSRSKKSLDFSELPISESAAKAFADYRKKIRKPLTQRALELAAREIRAASDQLGISDDDLVTEIELAGWQGVKADWLINRLANKNTHGGQRNGSEQPNPFNDDTDWIDGPTRERVIQAAGGYQTGLAGSVPGSISDCCGEESMADGVDGIGYFGLEHD